VGVTALADSSVNMRVVARTKTEQHYSAERALRKEVKKILDKAGIEIPFPQIVLHHAKDE
jgi:small conductance mechanosensitive channel